MKYNTSESLRYGVGALLYCPATEDKIVRQILAQRIAPPYSVALCLEDAIPDSCMLQAQQTLVETLQILANAAKTQSIYIPHLFIRVRTGTQAVSLYTQAGDACHLITGFLFPKCTPDRIAECHSAIAAINRTAPSHVYMMPILESREILSQSTRQQTLAQLRTQLDAISEDVLNIRVGGNDFCNLYRLRRNVHQTIYDIAIVKDCLTDILNWFSEDYVVSAPVWEYFDTGTSRLWEAGLWRELELDRLNGFIGKTVIHPSQIPVVNRALAVSPEEYADACQILQWNDPTKSVEKGAYSGRMQELTCHTRWAQRIQCLAQYYGIRPEKEEDAL